MIVVSSRSQTPAPPSAREKGSGEFGPFSWFGRLSRARRAATVVYVLKQTLDLIGQ